MKILEENCGMVLQRDGDRLVVNYEPVGNNVDRTHQRIEALVYLFASALRITYQGDKK